MGDQTVEIWGLEKKADEPNQGRGEAVSFRKARQSRKKSRIIGHKDDRLSLKNSRSMVNLKDREYSGPTKETLAKLTEDPLVRFRKKNILTDQQIWAFQRIRKAVQIITHGTQVRISCHSNLVVQTSRFGRDHESDYEIGIKDYYNNWIDQMTIKRLPAGPVLDIILDELSLNAVDRKWGKRKGWSKSHLQASLDLYSVFLRPSNRVK